MGIIKTVNSDQLSVIGKSRKRTSTSAFTLASASTLTSALRAGDTVVAIDPRYYRPTEVDFLLGDPSKAKKKLGWQAKVKLPELVKMMMESDLKLAERELLLKKNKMNVR